VAAAVPYAGTGRLLGQRRRPAPAPAFAQAAITPLYTRGEPLFVREVQHHLAKGHMPGAALAHEATWRPRQPWEDQPPLGAMREVSVSSPARTGTPDGYSFELNLRGDQGKR
jgi:hypothetical protein